MEKSQLKYKLTSNVKLKVIKSVDTTPTPEVSTSSTSSTQQVTPQEPLPQLKEVNPTGQLLKTPSEVINKVSLSWAEFIKKANTDLVPMKIELQSGLSKDWENSTRDSVIYLTRILRGNGLTLNQIPFFAYGETEEYKLQAYLKSGCHAPYMSNLKIAIYCGSSDIGSAAQRIGNQDPTFDPAQGYLLNPEESKILTYNVMHELTIFYELQAQYNTTPYDGTKDQIPSWLREGTAQLVATLAANDITSKESNYDIFLQNPKLIQPRMTSLCEKNLQDYEGLDKNWSSSCTHSQNLYAVELLVANHGGFPALFKFDKLFGKDASWGKDFLAAFNISREDFYTEWYEYLQIPVELRPELTPITPAQSYVPHN